MTNLFFTSLLIISFNFFPSNTSSAQKNIIITGRIIDDDTKEPLRFASISMIDEPIGTITNEDGEFTFNVPFAYANDTLVISFMGYSRQYILIKDAVTMERPVFRLVIKPQMLDEVVVMSTKMTGREIFLKAIENIEKNYPTTPYVMKAFFREMWAEDNHSKALIETAITIHDKGYLKTEAKRLQEKVYLDELRASKNYMHPSCEVLYTRFNSVTSALKNNRVRYPNTDLRKALTDNRSISLDSITYLNDVPVYVISFYSYITRYPLFERKNTLYVDSEHFSIYRYQSEEYATKGMYSETPWALTTDSLYIYYKKKISTTYEYESFKGKMFLKYFDEKCYSDILNSKNNTVAFESLGHTTLVVTEIEIGKGKKEENQLMHPGKSLYLQLSPYNSEFWNNYSQLVPLTKNQINDLEWKIPLQQQFSAPINEAK